MKNQATFFIFYYFIFETRLNSLNVFHRGGKNMINYFPLQFLKPSIFEYHVFKLYMGELLT